MEPWSTHVNRSTTYHLRLETSRCHALLHCSDREHRGCGSYLQMGRWPPRRFGRREGGGRGRLELNLRVIRWLDKV
eukprot:1793996-Pyramimonas_sp.AAC.1